MRLLFLLLACLLAAYAISATLTIAVNPETRFWAEAVRQREAAVTAIRSKSPDEPIIFFTGGSSCAFSIDPKIIEETCGVPAINLGVPVSCAPPYILHQALREAQKGDLIIVCLEPDAITYPDQEFDPSKTGFALEARRGNLTDAGGGSTFSRSLTIPEYLTLPRPGAKYLITLAARNITGKGYRYKKEGIGYHGLIRTEIRDPNLKPAGDNSATGLDPEGRLLLETFATAAKRKGVRIAYSMPWYYTATASLAYNRANKKKVLGEISKIMPVIEDGYSGAMDGLDNFADSGLHLSDKGSAKRSKALAASLRSQFPSLITDH